MKNIKMAKSATSVSFFVRTFVLFGVCLRSLEAYESFAPVTVPVAQLPVLFPDSHLVLDSQEPIQAPTLEAASDSDSNLVHVVHKEFHLEPIYKDILSEKPIDPSSFLEIKSSEGLVDREARKVHSGLGNIIKSLLQIPTPSQATNKESNDNTKRKSDNSEKVRQSDQEYKADEDNADGEENTSSYESSEEVNSDAHTTSNDKNGSTKKKNLQSDFFRTTNERPDGEEPDDDEIESREEDEEKKKPKDPQKIDIELLQTLSEQFILKNGELMKLNSSDFSVVNNDEENQKENETIQGHSKTEESNSEESEIVPSYEKKLIHNTRNRESDDEEIEGGYSPSKNGEGQNFYEQITQDEQNSKEYKAIVKTLVQQKLAEIREEQEYEDKLAKLRELRERVVKQKEQTFRNILQQSNSNYNTKNQDKPTYSNPIPQRQLLQNVNTNTKEGYNENYANLNNIPQPTRNSYLQIQTRNNVNVNANNGGSYAPPPAINSKLQNSILNLNLQRQRQNGMREKLSLVRQLQMYNKQTSISNSTIAPRKISQPSSYSPVNNYEQKHNDPTNPTAEADNLNVFLYGSPRFSTLNSLNSPKPTRQTAQNTYYDSPASYTRKPSLKLQQPIQNQPQEASHYDRTKFKALVTRPTKSSRTLEDGNNDNQWVPITPRPPYSNPEKIRNINSITKFSTNSGYSILSNNNDRSSAEKTSSSERKSQNSGYNNHPLSIQDILVNQKDSNRENENPNASVENRKPATSPKSAPLFHLIDDLTGVIEKHKTLATRAEDISGSQSIKQQTRSNEFLYSTKAPPTPAGKVTTTPTNNLQQQPTQYTNINVHQFHHYGSNPQQLLIPSNFSTSASTASSSYIGSPNNNKSNSSTSPSPPPPANNQELHYYADDIRAQLRHQKHLLAVKPYVPPNAQIRQPRKNPLQSFINSLHALAEKNRNRHSHVQELLTSFLSPKTATPTPERQRNPGGNHLIPSVYDAVPFYTLDPLPQDSINVAHTRPIPFLPRLRPINPEIEIFPGNNVPQLPQSVAEIKKSNLFLPRRPEDDAQDSNSRKPKELLGDKYTRLGENFVYRVHDIFKQFIPPVLHISVGSGSPP